MVAAAGYAFGNPTGHSYPPPSSQSAKSLVPAAHARVCLCLLYLHRSRCPAMVEHAEALCIDDLDEQQLHLPLHIHRLPRRQLQPRRTTGKVRLRRLRRFNTSIALCLATALQLVVHAPAAELLLLHELAPFCSSSYRPTCPPPPSRTPRILPARRLCSPCSGGACTPSGTPPPPAPRTCARTPSTCCSPRSASRRARAASAEPPPLLRLQRRAR